MTSNSLVSSPLKLNSLTAAAIAHKKVLLKVDYNVPLKKVGNKTVVADDTRIKASLLTLNFLLDHQAKVIITSHLGRPHGEPNPKYSLQPIADHLSKLLDKPVLMSPVPIGPEAEKLAGQLEPGQVLLLENSRFDPGEKKNSAEFAKQLAKLADVYVNDGFSAAHREHASVVGVNKYLPALAGFALEQEVKTLSELIDQPRRPFVAIVGGAKISDKVSAITNLSKIADVVLVGGGVANNFLKAEGIEIFRSYVEEVSDGKGKKPVSFVAAAEKLLQETKREKMLLHGYIPLPKIIYPSDVIAADKIENPTQTATLDLTDPDLHPEKKNWMFLDIGPKTRALFADIISQAKTIFWNGPMGVFEKPEFAKGTVAVARAMAKNKPSHTLIGGGDTIRAIDQLDLAPDFDVISAAGGAALEFLGNQMLPGLKPLLKKS